MIKAVIFDLDELIIDLEDLHKEAERQICERYGLDFDDLPVDLRLNSSGLREIDILEKIRTHFELATDITQLMELKQKLFVNLMLNNKTGIQAMPGVENAIHLLSEKGYLLAVTSSGSRPRVELILRLLGIFDKFNITICGEDVQHGKPHPEPYTLTAKHLNIKPQEGLVFEDADVGVRAAKSAGLWCIGVPNPRAKTKQSLSEADLVLKDLRDFSLDLLTKF